MSSEGTRKVVFFLCTVSFTLCVLRTCGSTKATIQPVSHGFNTYRQSGNFNKTATEGEDSGKEVRFRSLVLGRNLQTKYRRYGGIKVDGLRGNSLPPQTSLPNITYSELLKSQNNSNRINELSESSKLASESRDSQKNDRVSRGDSQPKSDTRSLNRDGENYRNLSRNSNWNDDTSAVKSKMEPLNNDSGYQSDTSGQAGLMGNLLALADSSGLPTVNILQAAESKPLILCGTDAMTLVANKNEYDYLKVDGVNDAPLYLSQLPSSCGHTFKRTSHHIVLKTPYDGCFITRKGDKYIMPLLWWESPVNISCPVTTPFPLPLLPFPPLHLFHPPAICTPFGMNINIEGGLNAAARLTVELRGKRVPFLLSQCGYHVIGNPAQPIIHVPYRACGMKMMAGMQVLSLFSGKTEKIFTCHLYPTSTPSFYHSVVPIHGYSSPPVVHQVPPLKVPMYPPVPDPFNYEQSLYTYPQAVLSVKSWPAPTKRTPVPPGYHPYSSVNPNIHLHPSAGGSSLPGFIPPFDSALHMQQSAFPVCTPSGPIPCIFPFPFHHHRDPLSPPPYHHHSPFSPPPPPHHHHDPFSPPPHHHHDPFSPPPPHYHHDPFSSPPPHYHHDPFSSPHHHHDPFSPPPHYHHDPFSSAPPPPPHYHHDPFSSPPPPPPPPPHYHHDPFSSPPPPPHYHHDPFSSPPPPPLHYHHDPLSSPPPPPHYHHDPFTSPPPPHYHHDRLSPPPHHHHDPLSPPPHHHHDPLTPPPHLHYDPFSLPHHHHDPLSPPPLLHYDPFSPPHHHHDPLSPLPHPPIVTASPFRFLSFPTSPTLSPPFLSCNTSHMKIRLSSAVPGTVKIRGPDNAWWPITSVTGCSFSIEEMGVKGVSIFSSLRPCHAYTVSPTKITLPIKFADADLRRHRILELQCPYYSPTSTLPTTHPGQTPQLKVFCSDHSMSVDLPSGPQYALMLQGTESGQSSGHRHCGYTMNKGENGRIVLSVPFTSCYMSGQGNKRNIFLKYQTLSGQEGEVPLSCTITPQINKQGCEISDDLRLPCGHGPVSPAECQTLGCCYGSHTHACYYPLDECTPDRHMIFIVPASLTDPPLSTSSLFTPGKNTCFPQKVTSSFALFKIPLDGCGVHKYEVGHTKIYMVEILNSLYAISLNYGTITRDSPVRLIVECRHSPSAHVSVGYLVKTPSLGPSIQAQGVFGVQLRIAKDGNYTDYYPQYHLPLSRLLQHPLYLEVRLLNPPDDNTVLLVHYCLAYPRSAQAAWVLNYDGCPNQLDPTGHLPTSSPSPLSHTRRFTIRTFQFLSSDLSYSDEEIYFMCSTEVCSQSDGPCVEGCLHFPSAGK